MRRDTVSVVSSALVFLFPALTLAVRGGVNTCFLGLLLTSMFYLLAGKPSTEGRKIPLYLVVSFLFFPLSILAQFIVTGNWNWPAFDAPARFLLVVPIIFLLPRLPINHLKLFQLGCVAGAIGAFLWAIYSLTYGGELRAKNFFTNPVPFGCISLVLALMSCGPAKGARWRKLLPLSGFLAGLLASYWTQSRGAFLLLPVAAIIWVQNFFDIDRQLKLLILLGVFIALFGLYTGSDMVKQRLDNGVAELLDSSRQDTSMGIRKQLWEASIYLVQQHPLVGVGKGNFHKSIQPLVGEEVITPVAATFNHAHNEMLFALAEIGVPGLIGIVLLYLGPLYYFWKYRKAEDEEIRTASVLGVILICGYAIYGLNDSMFTLSMQTAFYALGVVTLFSQIEAKLSSYSRRSAQNMASTA